ncbi:DUF3667 domain-containing protein [Winogradskyella sp. PE311]|uniref:DUF3667 domain-containing protein n=1 Tax=Winogradskyella sp. PE311 TaxID=3366943 RepID=UPI003980F0DB
MNCKNCHKNLIDTQRYCDNCGSPFIRNRLTPKILFQQINQQFLSIDNKFLKTFVALLIKPEVVIDGYINGLRKKYIGVITYYAIALTVLGFQMFLLKNLFPEFMEAQSNTLSDNFTVNNNTENPFANYPDFFNDYQGVFFSILMPFIAIGTWLIYLDKRKHNYTEHLVINLYLTAQTIYFNFIIYLLLAIFDIENFLVASIIATPPLILYGAFVFNRLYKSTYLKTMVRYIAAYTIYIIVFSIMMIILLVIMILYLLITGKLNL